MSDICNATLQNSDEIPDEIAHARRIYNSLDFIQFSKKNPLKVNKGKIKERDRAMFTTCTYADRSRIFVMDKSHEILLKNSMNFDISIIPPSSKYLSIPLKEQMKRTSSSLDLRVQLKNRYKQSQKYLKRISLKPCLIDSPQLLKFIGPCSNAEVKNAE